MVRFRVRVAFRLGLGLEWPLNTNREYVWQCVCVFRGSSWQLYTLLITKHFPQNSYITPAVTTTDSFMKDASRLQRNGKALYKIVVLS